jgi:hypothetical protein
MNIFNYIIPKINFNWKLKKKSLPNRVDSPSPKGNCEYRGIQHGGIWLNSICINGSIRDAFGSQAWNKLYNCPQHGRTTNKKKEVYSYEDTKQLIDYHCH